MKILTLISALGIGGAQQMAYELIKNIDNKEFDMTVLSYGGKSNNALESRMEQVCSVKYLEYAGHIGLQKIIKVMKCMTSFHPDIIHVHMGGVAFAIPWGLIHHKPVIVTVHTKPENAFSQKNEKLVKYGIKKGAVVLVAVSEENYKKVREYFNIIDDNQCLYINNGVDVNRFYREKHDGFAFINVATQDENKNQSILLKTFKKIHMLHPNTKLYLIGDGPCHSQLIELRHELKLDDVVDIPGSIGNPEVYYAKADVYVQTSHREAMPLSILEAISAGLPIISTDVGGIKDVVDTNGYLVNDNDEDALYYAMKNMLDCSTVELKQMEARSSEIADCYSSKKMAQKYCQLYRQCISK